MNWFKRQPHDAAALHEQLKAKSAPGNYQPEDTRTLKSYHDELFPESKFNHNVVKRNWTARNTDPERPNWYVAPADNLAASRRIKDNCSPATAEELLKEMDTVQIDQGVGDTVEWASDAEHHEVAGRANRGLGTDDTSGRIAQWRLDQDAPTPLKEFDRSLLRELEPLPLPLPNQKFVVYRALESSGTTVAWRGVPRFNNDYEQMNFLVRSGHLTQPGTYVTRRTIESYSPVYGSPTEIVSLFHITETVPVKAELHVHPGATPMASGSCCCGRPGYLAHAFRCPVVIEGDHAPHKPVE